MTTWLKQWYGARPLTSPMSVPGMMEMMAGMNQFTTAHNATFDKEFLSMMIHHHQEAINMAKLLPGKTRRPQLLTLGQNIIKAQSPEMQQMQTWQKQWFKASSLLLPQLLFHALE